MAPPACQGFGGCGELGCYVGVVEVRAEVEGDVLEGAWLRGVGVACGGPEGLCACGDGGVVGEGDGGLGSGVGGERVGVSAWRVDGA